MEGGYGIRYLVDSGPPEELVLGRSVEEDEVVGGGSAVREVAWSPFDESPHLLVAGRMGDGTTVVTRMLLAHVLRHPDEWTACVLGGDPTGKPVGYSQRGRFAVVRDEEAALDLLGSLAEECRHRIDRLGGVGVSLPDEVVVAELGAARGSDGYPDSSGTDAWTGDRRVLVVVECPEDYSGKVKDGLLNVARLGQLAGVHLAVMTNRPTNEAIPSALNAMLSARLILGAWTPAMAYPLMGGTWGDEVLRVPRSRGLFAPRWGGHAREVQLAYLEESDLERLASATDTGGQR